MTENFLGLDTTYWIIFAGAVVTFITRIAGDLVIRRYERLHPRVEAGLNAVPAAVMTAIVIPAIFEGGWGELLTVLVIILFSFRLTSMTVFFIGWAAIVIFRYFGL